MINNFFLFYFVFLNLLIFFNFKKISKILNIYDFPNERKLHKHETPLLGGFIIFINLLLFLILFFFGLYEDSEFNYFFSKIEFIIFYLASLLIFFLGSFDDKFNLNPNLKLLFLTIIISLTLLFDNSLVINNLEFSFINQDISLGKYSFVLTLLCFLLFINACNMFDGTNLQSTSYFIILIFYLIIIGINTNFLYFLLIALLFIFVLNKDGKIFMGDSGIYLTSFIIGYILIKIYNFDNKLSADLIFILMMVPGIDMFRLFILRLYNKKNPFSPDREHVHHLLLNKFSNLKTLVVLNFMILYPIILLFMNLSKLLIILIYIFQYIVLIFYLKKI